MRPPFVERLRENNKLSFASPQWTIDLSIYPSIYLYLSIYVSMHLSIYLPTYLSIHISIYLSIYPSISLSIYLSIHLYLLGLIAADRLAVLLTGWAEVLLLDTRKRTEAGYGSRRDWTPAVVPAVVVTAAGTADFGALFRGTVCADADVCTPSEGFLSSNKMNMIFVLYKKYPNFFLSLNSNIS